MVEQREAHAVYRTRRCGTKRVRVPEFVVASRPMLENAAARRLVWWVAAVAVVTGVVYLMATASTGPVDPTEVAHPQSHATVVFNAAMIVFREGLEAVLIFAAVTASFVGAQRARRRPVVGGAAVAFAATVLTWFVAQALLDVASPLGPRLEGITGFLAIVVLLIVLNWFVHKVYWSGWIGRHHRQRRPCWRGRGSVPRSGWSRSGSRASTARASRSCSSCRTCSCRTGRAPCSRA